MISKEITSMLNKQINAELWSAYLYLSMSLDADHKSLRGISNWFYVQAQEELHHAHMLQNYLSAQGAKVELLPISGVQSTWANPLTMFEKALQHEISVTGMIHEIVKEAQKEQDYATLSRMQWFVDEQVEEENNATNLVFKMKEAVKSPCYLYKLDAELAHRKYEEPEHLRGENWI